MELSALGRAMRGAGPWFYAAVNLAHILGIATLFGSILVLDLRLLGCWRRLPVAPLAAVTIPVAAVGVCIALPTGVAMLATNGSEYTGNPFLLIKFPAIAAGLVNVLLMNTSAAWRTRPRLAGALSLASWLTAITAGRMIAYW
jgi:hypothetical protein